MRVIFSHLRAHPRLMLAGAVGILVALAAPGITNPVTRALLGWNVSVWLYLILVAWIMSRAGPERVKQVAMAQAEGALVVLVIVTMAAIVSLGAVVYELSLAKAPGSAQAWPRLLYVLATVVGSWLMVPTLFALNYASLFYRQHEGVGLQFPDTEKDFKPDYGDFLYFSFTMAVASQTSDVIVSTRAMRRLVLLQALLSFMFNTSILAFTINIAASLF